MSQKKAENFIPGYQPRLQVIEPMSTHGGFDYETKTFKPFAQRTNPTDVMDAMAAATEAGILDCNRWVSQMFADTAVFRVFAEELSYYDECYRIRDRWYDALRRLANKDDEEGFITCDEIAQGLLDAAVETGQIPEE